MKKYILTLSSLAIIATLFVASCSKSPLDGITLKISPELVEYSVLVEVLNSKTSEPVDNPTIEFMGEIKDDILNSAGGKDFKFIGGVISLGLHPRVDIMEGEEKRLEFKISAPGYLSRTEVVIINNEVKNLHIPVRIMETANPPQGVSFQTGSSTLTGGTLGAPLKVEIPTSTNTLQSVEIDLPQGTEFFDRNGNRLTGSNLNVNVGSFDAGNAEALVNFPGGFDPENVVMPGGGSSDPVFATAGFVSVDMTVGGQTVRQFNNPIDIRMDVDPTTINPNTGLPVVAGDSIEIWSYDNVTEQWAYERTGFVVQGTNGLEITFPTTHLSWFNLDWFGNRCSQPTRLQINIPSFPANYRENFYVEIVLAGTNQLVSSWGRGTRSAFNGQVVTFNRMPFQTSNGTPINYVAKFYRNASKAELLATSTPMSCGQTANVTLNIPAPMLYTLNIEAKCENNNLITVRPTFFVLFRPTGTTQWQYLGWVQNGQASTTRYEMDATYDFRGFYNNEIEEMTLTIDKLDYNYNITIPANRPECANLPGG